MKISKIPGVQEVSVELSGKTVISADRDIARQEVQQALAGTDYQVI